jgi:hypothetical protein
MAPYLRSHGKELYSNSDCGVRSQTDRTGSGVHAHPGAVHLERLHCISEYLSLRATENLHRSARLKKLPHIREPHSPLIGVISEVLLRRVSRNCLAEAWIRRSYTFRSQRSASFTQQAHAFHDLQPRSHCAHGTQGAGDAYRRCRAGLSARRRWRARATSLLMSSISPGHCNRPVSD